MLKNILMLAFAASAIISVPSCNANKIPCPAYADSFPDKKAKGGKQKPSVPKPTKPKSGVLPPGYKGK